MKKFIIIVLTCIVTNLIFISLYSQVNIDNKYIKDNINSIRKQLKIGQFECDTNMSNAIIEINKKQSLDKISKDTLRKIARKYFNYDFDIEIIEIKLDEYEELNINNIKSKYTDLYNFISNPNYNRMGYRISKDDKKNKIQFILSKNNIVIHPEEVHIIAANQSEFNPEKIIPSKILIKGKVNANDVFFIKVKNCSEIHKIKSNLQGSKLNVSENNEFQIETDYDKDYIIFYDMNGEVISIFSYF